MFEDKQKTHFEILSRNFFGSTLQNSIYCVFAFAFVALMTFTHMIEPANTVSYQRDVWHHIAAYQELLKSPFFAQNPHVPTDDPSRFFGPWGVLVAAVGRLIGLDAQHTLGISAVLSSVLMVVGLFLFSREYWASKWAPLVLLCVMFFAWETQLNHTGFYTLATMIFSLSYPFGAVLALGFIYWWIVLKGVEQERIHPARAAVIGLFTAFLFATHQLQAAFAVGTAGVFAVFVGATTLPNRACILAAILVGLLVSKFWWYFDPIELSMLGTVYVGPPGPPFMKFDWSDPWPIIKFTTPALAGVAGFYDFERRKIRIELLFGAVAILLGIVLFKSLGSWMYGRFFPFLMFFLHLGLTGLLLQFVSRIRPGESTLKAINILSAGVLIFCVYIGSLTTWRAYQQYATARAYQTGQIERPFDTWGRDISERMGQIRVMVGAGSVVIADRFGAFPIQAHDVKVVAVPRIFPLVPDMMERMKDNELFFAAETPRERRCEILRRYEVTAILFRPLSLPSSVVTNLEAFGSPTMFDDLALVTGEGFDRACE